MLRFSASSSRAKNALSFILKDLVTVFSGTFDRSGVYILILLFLFFSVMCKVHSWKKAGETQTRLANASDMSDMPIVTILKDLKYHTTLLESKLYH
jgi:hypothetical protein